MDFDRSEYIADLLSKLDAIKEECSSLTLDTTDEVAFSYLIADMFETLDEGQFVYTDGPNDLGIDFYTHSDGSFNIYQCKSIDHESNPEGKTFGSDPVNQLEEAIEYLLHEERTASYEIKQLKGIYHLDPDQNHLTATLAIDGHLSPSAAERLDGLKRKYQASNIDIRLIDEGRLFEKWHAFENLKKPSDVKLKLNICKDGLMKMHGWLCAVVKIDGLIAGMKQYQNGLFDLNVRAKLSNSKVNVSIKRSLETDKGKKHFVHLNNGLVISCDNYRLSSDESILTINGAQVINGCQTLSTIWDYYFDANQDEKASLINNLQLFIKVINGKSISRDRLLDEIIVASNNQNPMNERNLKSNSPEQVQLQASFYRSSVKQGLRYYYIRKDGEFDAYLESGSRSPKKREFEIPGSTRRKANRYRHLDNEDLAKIWWSWIGNGSPVNAGSLKYFSDNIYSKIFESRPMDFHWKQEARPDFEFNSKEFAATSPSSYQLLLAFAVSKFIEAHVKRVGSRQLKTDAINRLISNGKLSMTANPNEISAALAQDDEYQQASWLSQMTYVLTEVAAFALINKYGPLTPETSKRILDIPDVYFWLEHGADKKLISHHQMENGLLNSLYTFLKDSAFSAFAAEWNAILTNTRPKMYLGSKRFIKRYKATCLENDRRMADLSKRDGIPRSTIQSLPPLP